MQGEFHLHKQLEADTLPFRELPLCTVRIMDNELVPWLVLVPRIPEIRDTIDLAEADQLQLAHESAAASHALRAAFKPDKLNVAALGNMVPQLHVHVVARFSSDLAWPKPVWGNLPAAPYSKAKLQEFCDALARGWP